MSDPHKPDDSSSPSFFTQWQNKLNELLENSPAKDFEKNVKATLAQGFAKLDLVTREEFDLQTQLLASLRQKVDVLEARVVQLENCSNMPARQSPHSQRSE